MTGGAPERMRRYEPLIVAAVLAAAVATLPLFFDASTLWTRRFWLDEQCCTLYAVNDARSFVDLFRTVQRSDVAPPLLHMIVWTVGKITGSLAPVVVRSIALTTILLSLLVLWVVLRRRFSVTATAAAVVAVASHGLVPEHAFDARFYGPWLLFATSYVAALGIDHDRPRSRRRDVAVALFALLLCTIHWFGVTSLGLMASAAVAAHGRRWRDGLRLVAPSALGLVALAALTPMMLTQLRVGGDDLLWVLPLSGTQVWQFTQAFLLRLPILLSLAVLLVMALRAPPPTADQRVAIASVLRDPSMAAMLATGLMTFVLVFISAAMNPVMVPRYAIASVLFAAPIVALAAESLRPYQRVILTLVFGVALAQQLNRDIRSKRYFAEVTNTYAALLSQVSHQTAPIVFQTYFLMYPVDGQARTASRVRVLDLPDSTIRALLPDSAGMASRIRKVRLDRNQARLHYRQFGFPIPITQAQLDSAPQFFFFGRDVDLTAQFSSVPALLQQLFPRHRVVRLNDFVTMAQRAESRR